MTQKVESDSFVFINRYFKYVSLDFIHVIKPCICELSGYITECIAVIFHRMMPTAVTVAQGLLVSL